MRVTLIILDLFSEEPNGGLPLYSGRIPLLLQYVLLKIVGVTESAPSFRIFSFSYARVPHFEHRSALAFWLIIDLGSEVLGPKKWNQRLFRQG